MKWLILSLSTWLACVMGATTGVFAKVNVPQVTPNTADSKSIATTLQVYLNAFNVGDLVKAYSMFADIKQHQSLKQFEAQGDPQKGWRPLLTSVYVVEKDNIADAYAKMTILTSNGTKRQNFLFVFPLIKENGTWKMVSDESDFGHQKYLVFKQIDKEINAYAQKHPMNH